MSIGLKRGTVLVEPHKVEWELSAQEIINTLKEILKENIMDAQHIGSTSIKGIFAKPIIDIVIGIKDFDSILKYNDVLMRRGILYRKEERPGQHLYVCGDLENNIHTHYIHAVIWGEKDWNNYINLRDYLNTHPEIAQNYSDLKKHLAKIYPQDRLAYTNEKSLLIEYILQCAKVWRKQAET